MTQIQVASLILVAVTFVRITGSQDIANKHSNDLVIKLQEKVSFLENTIFDLVKNNEDMVKTVLNLVKANENIVKANENMVKANKDIEDDLNHLKQLSKLNTVRTCEEMKEYGVDESGFYLVDPDGPLIGQEPIMVYCDFKQGIIIACSLFPLFVYKIPSVYRGISDNAVLLWCKFPHNRAILTRIIGIWGYIYLMNSYKEGYFRQAQKFAL